jgi:hypothetical protein
MNGGTVINEQARATRQGGEVHVAEGIISSIDSVVVPGAQELDHEAGAQNRLLLTNTHTMRAVDLCPEQGLRASRGFLDLFRG